jgi:hypothetical protein
LFIGGSFITFLTLKCCPRMVLVLVIIEHTNKDDLDMF